MNRLTTSTETGDGMGIEPNPNSTRTSRRPTQNLISEVKARHAPVKIIMVQPSK